MSLPVIVMQVGLVEHLRIHVSHQHVRDEVGTHKIENLGRAEGVVGRLHGIVINAVKLRLIVRPIRGVEEDIVGASGNFVKARGIAVNDTYVRRWIGAVIRLSQDRRVGYNVSHAILNQIRRDIKIVQPGDSRSYSI